MYFCLRPAIGFLAAGLVFMACSPEPSVSGDGTSVPDKTGSIAQLRSLYNGQPRAIKEDIRIRAGVISSDWNGNIYKSIVLEDSTGGIEVKLNLEDIFLRFGRGRTVILQCNSLTIGSYGGRLQLGGAPTAQWETDPIAAEKIPQHISLLEDVPEAVIPARKLKIASLSQRYVNCWVCLEEVQFIDEEYRGAWGDVSADTDRHIVDRQGDTLAVRVSKNATFVNSPLPSGSGFIEGILSYFNRNYQLLPISDYENDMTGERFAVPAI